MTKPTNNQLTAAERLVDRTFGTSDAECRMQVAESDVLATYLALPEGQRAPLWRQMTDAQRRRLVSQQLIAKHGDTTEEEISGWVDRTNKRWGSEPTQTEVATLEACQDLARQAVFAGDPKQADAYLRAHAHYQNCLRPVPIEGGWHVPSATNPGEWHMVLRSREYGDPPQPGCDCPGAMHGRKCWHVALVAAIETAIDRIDQGDDDTVITTPLQPLGQRLAIARRQLLEVA